MYVYACLLISRKRTAKNIYPAGDIMLHQWLADETADDLPIITKNQKKSLLDDDPQINIPNINSGFKGGFKINNDILKDTEE